MKSVRYVLGSFIWGKDARPRNLDDCLDYSNKSTPKKVAIELDIEELKTDLIVKYLSVKYKWTFEDKQAEYSTFYEMIFAVDLQEAQRQVVDQANILLEYDLERIADARIPVEGEEKRFDYDLIY